MAPSGLSYADSPVVATVGVTQVSASPAVTGKAITYSVSPALPAGVSLNTTTGVISGTPTATSAKTDYTVTATNSGGSTSAVISIEVTPVAPSANASQFVCGSGTVSDLSATPSSGATLRWYDSATGGALLNGTTALVNGTNYYAASVSSGVESASRTAVLLTINALPDAPVIVAQSTSNNQAKLCPNDDLVCSNFDNSLDYQWYLNENNLNGENGKQYTVPASGSGVYGLTVKNPSTGCENTAAPLTVQVQSITTPVIDEMEKKETISILIVNNTQKLYTAYLWTYGDGTPLPLGLIDNRQFLVLPPADMNATYAVKTTDVNGCTTASATRTVTMAGIVSNVYPTVSNGNFKVSLTGSSEGTTYVNIYNLAGVLQRNYSFEHNSTTNEFQINAYGLAPGIYEVEITLGNYRGVKKIVIQ